MTSAIATSDTVRRDANVARDVVKLLEIQEVYANDVGAAKVRHTNFGRRPDT